MVNELTIAKGAFSVTLYSDNIVDNYTNKIFLITGATTSENQETGASDTKIVDLLRIVHQIVIKGFLTGSVTKTNKQVKEDLVSIFKGGGTAGGVTTLTYDTDAISGYIEKLTIIEKAMDNPATTDKELARYEIALTFIEGTNI